MNLDAFPNDRAGNLSVEPGFFDVPAGDFRLWRRSALVDAGPEGMALCADEPQADDGTCRMDVGHLGGTAQAWSRPPE